jgi:molecular chaperone Hsp33
MDKSTEHIKEKLRNRDRLIRVMTNNQHFRATLIKNTTTALTAQQNHKLSGIAAIYLARALSGASLIASFLKGEERAIVEIQSSGLISKIYAEASQNGEVRGYLHLNTTESKIQVNHTDELINDGILKVTRILYDKSEPVTGVINVISGDIAADLTEYYDKSEQIPSAILMDVVLDDEQNIAHSSAFIVQAIPGYNLEELKLLLGTLSNNPSLSELFNKFNNFEEVFKSLLPFDFQITANQPVDFFCRCSKEKFINAMFTLKYDEVMDMQKDGQNELVCQYCNKHYYLTDDDFEKIKLKIKSRTN